MYYFLGLMLLKKPTCPSPNLANGQTVVRRSRRVVSARYYARHPLTPQWHPLTPGPWRLSGGAVARGSMAMLKQLVYEKLWLIGNRVMCFRGMIR